LVERVAEDVRNVLEAIRASGWDPAPVGFSSRDPAGYVTRARLHLETDQNPSLAALMGTRALALKNDHAEAHLVLGLARLSQGRLDEAIPALQAAARLDPGLREAYGAVGRAFRERNDYEAAAKSFSAALGLAETADVRLKLGDVYEAQQNLVEARAMYRMLLDRFPESGLISRTQERLGQVNISLLFSPIVTELDALHQVQKGDTLGKIASANGTTVEFLKRANGLASDTIRPQQKLKVPKGRFTIVVDKSQKQLLLTEDNQFIKTYAVGTGEGDSTPEGTFKIVNRIPNPVWYKQGAVVPQGSPENILGTRWMGFDKSGYGIHGSVDPTPITQQTTAGCVRMTNSDVEELFAIVPVGTEVTIVN